MGGKRKRPRGDDPCSRSSKHLKLVPGTSSATPDRASSCVLAHYYSNVLTLRDYVLWKLPKSFKARRRKIALFSTNGPSPSTKQNARVSNKVQHSKVSCGINADDSRSRLSKLLDHTLVGFEDTELPGIVESRFKDFEIFTQQSGSAGRSSLGEGTSSISEVRKDYSWCQRGGHGSRWLMVNMTWRGCIKFVTS